MFKFKNCIIFNLNKDIDIDEDKLKEFALTPCDSLDKVKSGWVSPNHTESLIHNYGVDHSLIMYGKEEKILPSSVIQRELKSKISKEENIQQRKLKKIERESLKDEVILDLLPRAFSNFHYVYIWINHKDRLVIVDSASQSKAEDVLSFLRKTLDGLPVSPIRTKEAVLTQWVTDTPPQCFALEYESELISQLDGSRINCKNQELCSNEIEAVIKSGKQVTRLGLNYLDRMSFVLHDDLSIRKIAYFEILSEQNQHLDKSESLLCFDADFTLMVSQLGQVINVLIEEMKEGA